LFLLLPLPLLLLFLPAARTGSAEIPSYRSRAAEIIFFRARTGSAETPSSRSRAAEIFFSRAGTGSAEIPSSRSRAAEIIFSEPGLDRQKFLLLDGTLECY
jgi:hypothetical protein